MAELTRTVLDRPRPINTQGADQNGLTGERMRLQICYHIRDWEGCVENVMEIRGFFDRVGPWFYAFFFTLLGYRASLRHFSRLSYPHLGLKRGAKILDAGIGTGFLSPTLLREAQVRFTVTGLDFSFGMWIGLQRRLRKLNLKDQVKFLLGDMRQMPFRKESFDLIVSSAAMEYLPEVDKGIAECCRVLRPGGRLLIITTRRTFMGKLIALSWRGKTLEPARMAQHMRNAGIQYVKRLRFPWYFPHVNWWGMVLLGQKSPKAQDEACGS